MKLALTIYCIAAAIVLIGTFNYNLPTWCDTPHVGHNYIVQPLCK